MPSSSNGELEQFLIVARAQRGRACAALIQQILGNRKVFHFGELLSTPSVAALADSPDYQASYRTLELFSYHTYRQYKENPDAYLELSEAQSRKLKLLTVVSLAEKSSELAYSVLMSELDMGSQRALEDLLIESIYLGLTKGKIDQRAQVFHVLESEKRDVHPQELPDIISKLKRWRDRCVELNESLEASNSQLRSEQEASRREQEQAQNVTDKIKASLQDSMVGGGHLRGLGPSNFTSHPGQGPMGSISSFFSGSSVMR